MIKAITATRSRRALLLLLKIVLAGAAAVLAALLALTAYLYVCSRQIITLPAPTGPFAVGRTSFDWTDEHRIDSLAPRPGVKRELMVWVWYPTAKDSARLAPYFPETLVEADRRFFLNGPIARLLIHDPALVRAHSLDGPAAARGKYPIILLKSGFGALALQYSAIAEDLASRGYVVVGMDEPYSAGVVAFPDGRVVTRSATGSPSIAGPLEPFDRLVAVWAADSSFVLDRLKALDENSGSPLSGHLDLASVGILGHSFGGASAAQFCAHDDRCRAGIDFDGRLFGDVSASSLRAPFMFLLTDHSGEPDSQGILSEIKKVYDHLPPGRMALAIRGTRHFNISDLAFLRSPVFLSRAVGAIGPLDRLRALKTIEDCVSDFFDAHLKGRRSDALQMPGAAHPEVQKLGF